MNLKTSDTCPSPQRSTALRTLSRTATALPMAVVLAALAGTAVAFQDTTAPVPKTDAAAPAAQPDKPAAPADTIKTPVATADKPATSRPTSQVRQTVYGSDGRRVVEGEPKPLAFKNVSVDQLIPFIVECTGKVVMPQQDVLSRKITILNDRPIPRSQAF